MRVGGLRHVLVRKEQMPKTNLWDPIIWWECVRTCMCFSPQASPCSSLCFAMHLSLWTTPWTMWAGASAITAHWVRKLNTQMHRHTLTCTHARFYILLAITSLTNWHSRDAHKNMRWTMCRPALSTTGGTSLHHRNKLHFEGQYSKEARNCW